MAYQSTISEISTGTVQGYHLVPHEKNKKGIVLTFGGSEGSSMLYKGIELAEEGFEVFSLYYFGRVGLASSLDLVELSFIEEVFDYINYLKIDASVLTILAASRGTELALLIAKHYQLNANLVLYSPSAYVFIGDNNHSAWQLNGAPFSFIHFSEETIQQRKKDVSLPLITSFEEELKNETDILEKKIDVSRLTGNILLFVGEMDTIWPSFSMAKKIKEDAYSAQSCQLYSFKEAGHVFSNHSFDGGTYDGNDYASYRSQQLLRDYLTVWHAK